MLNRPMHGTSECGTVVDWWLPYRRRAARPSSLGGKGVKLHPPAPALLPSGILLPSLYGAAHTCMVRAVLYCTVLYARKGRRARGAENFSRSARARTGEKVHKSSRILHALLKKTCKTGGCLLKLSDQDLPRGLTSEKFGKHFRARAFTPVFTLRPG